MANNPLSGIPNLLISQITDIYARTNFQNLANYFAVQNQLLNFKFFEVNFTKAQTNYLLAHGLGSIPQDVIITRVTGSGSVTFNYGLFDATNVNITTSGACRVRFFVGSYWNFATTVQNLKTDLMQIYASLTQSSSSSSSAATSTSVFTNPMTAVGDMIIGGVNGAPTRLANGSVGQVLTALGGSNPEQWALPPGNYYWSGYYPGSGTNYWTSTTGGAFHDFTVTGTPPNPTVMQTANFPTVTKNASSHPSATFTPTRSGVMRVTFQPSQIFPPQSSAPGAYALQLVEGITGTVLAGCSGYQVVPAPGVSSLGHTLVGYYLVTQGTVVDFRLQATQNNGNPLYFGSAFNAGQMLAMAMEYIT